jgi:hypothetical protein
MEELQRPLLPEEMRGSVPAGGEDGACEMIARNRTRSDAKKEKVIDPSLGFPSFPIAHLLAKYEGGTERAYPFQSP